MEKDVEEIVNIAKKILTQFGQHAPMLFVRGSKSKGMVTFNDFGPDHEDKIRQMANAGVDNAMKHNSGDLHYLIFVTEAWVSTNKEYLKSAPSKDPKRKEMLIITTLDVVTKKQGLLMYQMIRDKRGNLIELNKSPFPEEATVESPLLPAFVAGYNLITR